LHRARYFAQAILVVASVEDVDLGDRHLRSPSLSSFEPSSLAVLRASLWLNARAYTRATPVDE
jgi:hypothetical protein